MKKYIVFTKTNLEKTFFYKKQIGKYFFGKKIWKYFFPCFHEGVNYQGGTYQVNSGILEFS